MNPEDSRSDFVPSFFVLEHVLGHFCNVLLQIPVFLKQNIAESFDENLGNDNQSGSWKPPILVFLRLRINPFRPAGLTTCQPGDG